MGSDVKTVVCPSCGASSHDLHNCEYCGSLLVRFAEKGIDVSDYRHDSFKFKGIEEALLNNLEEQARSSGRNHVTTFINAHRLNLSMEVSNPAAQTEMLNYSWGKYNFLIKPEAIKANDTQSLSICVRFYEITDKLWGINGNSTRVVKELNSYNVESHSRFRRMNIYPLFSLVVTDFLDNNNTPGMKIGKVSQYYLNFGRDVDAAAAIISQYFLHNFDIAPGDDLSLHFELTSISDEEYAKSVKKVKNSMAIKKWLAVGFGAVCFIAGILGLLDANHSSLIPIAGGLLFIVFGFYYYGNG